MTRIEQGLIQSGNDACGMLQQRCSELFRALPQTLDSLIILKEHPTVDGHQLQ
jgi:hypothetical protein